MNERKSKFKLEGGVHTQKTLAQAMKLHEGRDEEYVVRTALRDMVKNRSAYLQEVAIKLMRFCSRNGIDPLDVLIFAERRFGQVYARVGAQDSSGEVTVTLTGDGLKRLSTMCSTGTLSPSEMIEELLTERWVAKFSKPDEVAEPIYLDDDLVGKLDGFCPSSMPLSVFASSLLRSLVSDEGKKLLTETGQATEAWWDDVAGGMGKSEREFGIFISSVFSSEIDGEVDLDEWRKTRRSKPRERINVMITEETLERLQSLRKVFKMGISEYLEFGMVMALDKIRELLGIQSEENDEEADD